MASIFAAHGVWVGAALRSPDSGNPHGYYENDMMTQFRALANYGEGMQRGLVYQTLIADEYEGGPWLVKHSPSTWMAWKQFSPKWVLVRRDMDMSVESRIRCGQWDMTEPEHRIAVEADNAILDGISHHLESVSVTPDAFFNDDWQDMKMAFEFCGLEFNERNVHLDSSAWHRKG